MFISARVFSLFVALAVHAQVQAQVTPPEKFFGFQLGSDRKIARWDQIVAYFQLLQKGKLNEKFNVIILPEDSTATLVGPGSAEGIPPEYRSGFGSEGTEALKAFVQTGGTLVTLGGAGNFAIEKLALKVRNLNVPAAKTTTPPLPPRRRRCRPSRRRSGAPVPRSE